MSDASWRPHFRDIDAWGLTHPGKVRDENQDHFFVGAIARGVTVDATSVIEHDQDVLLGERLASLAIVADGVGSTAGGGEAARLAVRALLAAVSRSFHEAEYKEDRDPEVFTRLLHDAAVDCHESLLARAEEEGGRRTFATTLTFFLGLWPHAYLLQVGDSRCYVYQDDRLTQISRDQTFAEALVESGALTRTQAEKSRWADALHSTIGGPETAPVVTRVERKRGTVVLLCTDGLTKHVPDERIAERMAGLTSSQQVAEQLLQDALDDGGTDNVSIVVGRTLRPDESPSSLPPR